MSRQADHEMGIDLDNTNQVLLKPEFFAINTLEATHKSPINDDIILKEVVRTTGHKTPGEFSVILQLVVMIQLTSRRTLRD